MFSFLLLLSLLPTPTETVGGCTQPTKRMPYKALNRASERLSDAYQGQGSHNS